MALNDVITGLGGSATFQVTRTTSVPRVNGRYVPGPQTTFDIVAAIQPSTGRELKDLEEGRRGDEIVTVFTATDLVPIKPGVDPDVFRYLGSDPLIIALVGVNEPWTVIRANRLVGIDGGHVEALAARAPQPAGVVP